MQPSTYAAGVRRRYEDLPGVVQQWVDSQLGSPVVDVRNATGGFSPGVAAVVTGTTGEQLFVKAVGSHVNAEALRLYRAEREVSGRLSAIDGLLTPVGGTDLQVDGESFAVILYPSLPGRPPQHPWRRVELDRVLDALYDLSRRLTPAPSMPHARTRLVDFFSGWQQVAGDVSDPWRRDPWVAAHLGRLVVAEEDLRAQLPGDTLTHADLRADNLMLDPEHVWFVDWAHAQSAATWVDAAILMSDVIASRGDHGEGGEIDVVATMHAHRTLAGVQFETHWLLQIAMTGALHASARRPSPPGLPTIRVWQAHTAETLLAWCRRSSPLT